MKRNAFFKRHYYDLTFKGLTQASNFIFYYLWRVFIFCHYGCIQVPVVISMWDLMYDISKYIFEQLSYFLKILNITLLAKYRKIFAYAIGSFTIIHPFLAAFGLVFPGIPIWARRPDFQGSRNPRNHCAGLQKFWFFPCGQYFKKFLSKPCYSLVYIE